MGFTSELEELRGDIFKRIATLDRATAGAGGEIEPVLEGEDKQLSESFPRRWDSSNRRSPRWIG